MACGEGGVKLNQKTAYERLDEIEKRLDQLFDNTKTVKELLDRYIALERRLNAVAPEHKPKMKKVWINVWYDEDRGMHEWHVKQYSSLDSAQIEAERCRTRKYYVVGMEAEVPDGR